MIIPPEKDRFNKINAKIKQSIGWKTATLIVFCEAGLGLVFIGFFLGWFK